MAEKIKGAIAGHPILAGVAIAVVAGSTVIYVAGGVGGGILRRGVLRGSISEWFDKLTELEYEPAWIVPEVNFRVVIVKPYKTPLSLAPIVGTYDFFGIWKLPFTRFRESTPPD